MFAGRQVGVFLEMFRAQRLGNRIFTAEPFAEVNQFAALGTKRRELSRRPVAGFFTGRASDFGAAHLITLQSVPGWWTKANRNFQECLRFRRASDQPGLP